MGKEKKDKKVKKEDKKSKKEEKKEKKSKKEDKEIEIENKEAEIEKKAEIVKKEAEIEDDTFNVLTEMSSVAEEVEEKKKTKKGMTEEEKEEQRRINRESREKKKLKKDINKKRKRGELTEEEDQKTSKIKIEKKPREPEFGVWVGNLSYATTNEAIRGFFKDCGTITRMKCPTGNGVKNNNKGFAYVFFGTPEEQTKAVAKSEQNLEGRSLLIKDAKDFERADGSKAPTEAEKKEIKKQKNPPCPTLFVGNLSFETTEKTIREAFEWAGDIRKIRMATFEDSGKCKGFGYVDYHTVEAATKAIRAPDKHTFGGRKCRVEFASEEAHMRSKPWLVRERRQKQ
ncbi:hypothetical protein CU098_005780 [Rhizopus stolonifer]|uniref:RRM domain-containing protein n=1 Tax=Rhizopus stolonifer TaxID=4846 RepID=A0A367ISF1_RHIST|nr:hypothetical protein CU098_005780 [Rhizopus stolonifer]